MTLSAVRWIAIGAALLVAMVILGLVTMLSATESDHDVRAMVAVGAPPRIRRGLLGLQGGLHSLVGAVLAVPLGLLLVKAVLSAQENDPQGVFGRVAASTMWVDGSTLAAVLVGVPLTIGLVISLLARSARTTPPRRHG